MLDVGESLYQYCRESRNKRKGATQMNFLLKKKKLLAIVLGLAGGGTGACIGELVTAQSEKGFFLMILSVSIWMAINSILIYFFLTWASELYNRKPGFPSRLITPAIVSGGLAGLISGGIAELVFCFNPATNTLLKMLFQSGCWGIAGALLGWRISKKIPNMGILKGTVAGFSGGFIGGFIFLIGCIVLPETIGRLIGIGILGAALGLCITLSDELFREAYLEILWGPNEKSIISIGSDPVYIGTGKDTIYVKGLREKEITVKMTDGRIICIQKDKHGEIELRNNSQIKVGSIQIIIHANK